MKNILDTLLFITMALLLACTCLLLKCILDISTDTNIKVSQNTKNIETIANQLQIDIIQVEDYLINE